MIDALISIAALAKARLWGADGQLAVHATATAAVPPLQLLDVEPA